jgi:hypothetical protein
MADRSQSTNPEGRGPIPAPYVSPARFQYTLRTPAGSRRAVASGRPCGAVLLAKSTLTSGATQVTVDDRPVTERQPAPLRAWRSVFAGGSLACPHTLPGMSG